MSEQLTADEPKKDEKKESAVKITVKSWDVLGKKFLNPQEGIDARRVEFKGVVYFWVPVKQAIGRGEPCKGSEITDADGTVYVVTRGSDNGSGEYSCTCEKKKKP